MIAPLYTVKARWIQPGSRVADGLVQTLYFGRDGVTASEIEDAMHEWALDSTCGGVVVVTVYEGDKVVNEDSTSVPIGQLYAPIKVTPGAGYPAHECGSPMVPGDVLGSMAKTKPDQLFCVGCCVPVDASPADRLRATTAASVERRARAS